MWAAFLFDEDYGRRTQVRSNGDRGRKALKWGLKKRRKSL